MKTALKKALAVLTFAAVSAVTITGMLAFAESADDYSFKNDVKAVGEIQIPAYAADATYPADNGPQIPPEEDTAAESTTEEQSETETETETETLPSETETETATEDTSSQETSEQTTASTAPQIVGSSSTFVIGIATEMSESHANQTINSTGTQQYVISNTDGSPLFTGNVLEFVAFNIDVSNLSAFDFHIVSLDTKFSPDGEFIQRNETRPVYRFANGTADNGIVSDNTWSIALLDLIPTSIYFDEGDPVPFYELRLVIDVTRYTEIPNAAPRGTTAAANTPRAGATTTAAPVTGGSPNTGVDAAPIALMGILFLGSVGTFTAVKLSKKKNGK